MYELLHWIDGSPVAGGGNAEPLVVLGPHTREQVARVSLGDAEQVALAVASARRAFPAWRDLAAAQRSKLLAELARAIREHADEFIETEIVQTGKLRHEMTGLAQMSADYFEYYAGVARALFGETINLGAGDHAFTTRAPYGVVGMITPWNGPMSQASRGISAALAAGNTVVIKPSEFTPGTTLMLAKLATEVGIPAGVLNVVLGTGPVVGSGLTSHPDVALLAFTGSAQTGRTIAKAAAERLIPVILELGGKGANIIFEDADLDRACASALSICSGAGQQCSALSRLLVQRSIYESVVERVGAAMRARTPGERLAPMTTEEQFAKVNDYFRIARDEGARLVTGGRAADGPLAAGRYVEATLFADVTPDMRIFQEEIFGPVLAATPFDDEAQAIELANNSEYGLTAGVWTSDSGRALRVAALLDCGQVLVNGGTSNIETPFGGYKASGLGREKGFESLYHYTQVKTTIVSTR